MNTLKNLIAASFSMLALLSSCSGPTNSTTEKTMQQIQRSHIKGNVPDKSAFDVYLKRDLEKYFSKENGKVLVKWEFLREAATQSGGAYPKYYLWTKIYKDEKLVIEGATRVAAIEKTKFDVTDFVSLSNIKKDTSGIYQIFPAAVCETIKLRL